MRADIIIGRCHGFTGRPNDPYCYHPGPGILPVWASDLCAGGVVLLFIVLLFLGVAYACRPLTVRDDES